MTEADSVRVNLALQGGGSHGAFAWGVLDRLLEDGRVDFAAISGTSAGAMNAVALVDGYVRGGRDGARQRLESFWRAVGRAGRFSPVMRTPWDRLWGNWSVENSPGYLWFDSFSRLVSPYLANPLNLSPLRDVVQDQIDFANVNSCEAMKLFVSATNVETGKIRIFGTPEITLDTVMASACLPQTFQAVTIDGAPYWDGGYGGNPALFPFFDANRVEDVLLVQVNPVIRQGAPRTAAEIQNRIDEITFNSALLREFRAIAFVKELIAAGRIPAEQYRDIRMHRIDADDAFRDLSASSKVNAEWAFLEYLRDLGRSAAEDWLADEFQWVGKKATLDLADELLAFPTAEPTTRRGPGPKVRRFLAQRKHPAGVTHRPEGKKRAS